MVLKALIFLLGLTAVSQAAGLSGALPAKNYPCNSILDYGGAANDSTDNSAAFNAAIASGGSQACVYLPAGKYAFTAGVTVTLPTATASVMIRGDGAEVTFLDFKNGGGVSILLQSEFNSFHVRDMTLMTGTQGGGNSAIYVDQTGTGITNPANGPLSDITGVTMRGNDGWEATNWWDAAINVYRASNINMINDNMIGSNTPNGVGVRLKGSSSDTAVVFNITDCNINNAYDGLLYDTYVQGVTVSQSNFTNNQIGIYIPTGGVAQAELTVIGNQFQDITNGISLSSGIGGVIIQGNSFEPVNNTVAIYLSSPGLVTIIGNTFFGLGATNMGGIYVTGSSANTLISGNAFVLLGGTCIQLTNTSSNVNVQSNSYLFCGTNVVNSGSSNVVGGGSP